MRIPRPSTTFFEYAEDKGPVVTEFDAISEVISFPALIAASGRSRSLEGFMDRKGRTFASAGCHYIQRNLADAEASQLDGKFCFTVFDVIPYQLVDVFSLALSIPSFFGELGDPGLEDLERVRAREKPAGFGFFRSSSKDPLLARSELAFPLCPIREEAALYFTGLALDAIWSHEIGHAFMGHLGFAFENFGLRALNEVPDENGSLSQMPLEAEADRFSANVILQSAFGQIPYLPRRLNTVSVETRVKAAFVASAVLTWLWAYLQRIDRSFDGIDPYEKGGHPPPLARFHLVFESNRDFLKRLGWGASSIEKMIFEAMSELEHLAVGKDWFSILHPERTFSQTSKNFFNDLKQIMGNEFARINEGLKPFRFNPPTK
jgi:hypothetical protein